MRTHRNVWTILIPLCLYLLSAILVGCGGTGGGDASGAGSAGGNSGGGSGGSSSGGGSGGETGGGSSGGSSGGETGGGSTGGGSTGGGSTGGGSTGGGTGGGTGGSTGGGGGGEGNVYFLSDKDGPLAVYRINLDGSGLQSIGSEADVSAPNVSWNGNMVLYEKWGLYADVFRMGGDGSSPTQVYAGETDNLNPCVSPNGQFVIFSLSTGGVPQLYRTTINGGNLTQLTNENEGVRWGRYSPDGSKVVFATASGDLDIKIMNADGSNVVALATGEPAQEYPMFNSAGTHIVFAQDFGTAFDPNYQIMSMSVAGGAATRLTTSLQDDRWPCFSPNGQFVAFSRLISGHRHIFYVPAAGGGASQVTTFGGFIGWLSAVAG